VITALFELGVVVVTEVAVKKSSEFVGVSVAFNPNEVTDAPGIQAHCAVNGKEAVVVTVSQPEIVARPFLNVTSPGVEAVAVIVSTAPYVGVAVARLKEMVGVAFEIVRFDVAAVSNK
jgi:hypothetical protein